VNPTVVLFMGTLGPVRIDSTFMTELMHFVEINIYPLVAKVPHRSLHW
jgi:hypothetical protein